MKRRTNTPQIQYPIIVHTDADGIWAECPLIAGCYSQGDTIDEALRNIEEAIAVSIADLPKKELLRMSKSSVGLHFVGA